MGEQLNRALRPIFSGRRCILVGGVFVGAASAVRQLLSLGADRPVLVVYDTIGTGPAPDPADAVPLLVDTRTLSTIETIRRFERALAEPAPAIRDALDGFDPDRSALVLGSPFSTAATLAGRERFGRRRREWATFEDKTQAIGLLAEVGAMPVPAEVVHNAAGEIAAAMKRVDGGAGVVVAGDTATGHTGFSEYTRWVVDPADVEPMPDCHRVRVMPLLEGVPCSIHGLVIGSDVAVFRPVEMITLLDASRRFRFAGAATYWDPPTEHRERMRRLARRIGKRMAEIASYRGAFTLDGVMTPSGFVATEINARWGGALALVAGALPHLPLFALDHALRQGINVPVDVGALETTVVQGADARRAGTAFLSVAGERERGDTELAARMDGTVCAPGEPWDFRLQAGGMRGGVHVRVVPHPDLPPRGPPLAPLAAHGFSLCDQLLGTAVGPLISQAEREGA